MQTQQVLDNLAMFMYNPNSMPYFSYPNTSSTLIADSASGAATPGFGRSTGIFWLNGLGLSFNASRQASEGLTVTPVNDPRKLELMRCAYQTAIRNCGCGVVSKNCPDCQTRFNVFYTGDPNGNIRDGAKGIVTSECLKPECCWFHVCCKKCMPKHCDCLLTGSYCGVHVWVGPEGRNELTKLTLAILDYATNNPPVQATKTVVYYVDAYGLPTTQSKAVGTVTAAIGVTEQNLSLLSTPRPDEARFEESLDRRLRSVREQLNATKDADQRKTLLDKEQSLQDKLDFLHERLRTGGLKQQYYQLTPNPTGFNALGVQQQLNTLSPTPTPPPTQ